MSDLSDGAVSTENPEVPLTLEQRVTNTELVIASFVAKVEEVLKVYMEEIQKTQRAVLGLMSTGTKKQQKLALPPQYRKPYIRDQESEEINAPTAEVPVL